MTNDDKNMSLRLKIYLFFAMLLIITLIMTTGILITNARQSVHTKVESAMTAAAHLLSVAMPPTPSRNSPTAHQRMGDLVKVMSEIRGLYIMVYRNGQLLYAGGPNTDNLTRPPDLFIKMLSPTIKPLVTRFAGGMLVIHAEPILEITERWQDIRALVTFGAALSVFILLILYVGINRLLRPLEYISTALAGFGKGNLNVRLPDFSIKEMNNISDAFNSMGEALQGSIEENQRMATLVKQSSDAIVSLDHTGKITFFNAAAKQMFPELASGLNGKSFLHLKLGGYEERIINIIEEKQSIDNMEITLNKEDQCTSSMLLSISPLANMEDKSIGFICTVRDVTEHKQAELAKHQLRESRLLTQHIANVQENERRNLARELHDELGQCLTAIKTDAVLIRNRNNNSDPKISHSAQVIIDVASHIYDVVHHMLARLRPTSLDDLGLVLTLQDTIETWQERQPDIKFHLQLSGNLNNLDEEINMTIFRIIQESITNAVRHAGCSQITVSVAHVHNERKLYLDIYDNGKGMQIKDFYSDVDFGILGMQERTQNLKGEFKLVSKPGDGVKIKIKIPLEAEHIL